MNPGGLVLIGLGALALCQLFGGNLLGRLNLVKPSTPSTSQATPPAQNPTYGNDGPDLPAPPLLGPGGKPPTAPTSPLQPVGLVS